MKDVFGSESIIERHLPAAGSTRENRRSPLTIPRILLNGTSTRKGTNIPAGLFLEMAIETPITEGQSAVGDPITAILKKSVKLGSGLIAPKGAFVHGRMTHLRRQETSRPAWVVGLTFFEIEWPDTRASLRAKLESAPAMSVGSRIGRPSYRRFSVRRLRKQVCSSCRTAVLWFHADFRWSGVQCPFRQRTK